MIAKEDYTHGFKGGLPIGLGYLSVSFSFGIMAAQMGFPWWSAILISMTNLTSAGQVAGILIIAAGGGYIELALSQVIINLRYALMSITLSQKLDRKVTKAEKLLMSFGMTDEIFALCVSKKGTVNFPFFLGVMTLPYIGWSLGTTLGVSAGAILPEMLIAVLGIAIYGMFMAIVLPVARKERNVAICCLIAVVLSCIFYYVPFLSGVSSGISIIICTLAASCLAAWLFPVKQNKDEEEVQA